MKKLAIFFFLVLGFLETILAKSAWATVHCEQQYGGEVCVAVGNLEINKLVWDPTSEKFVDNLDVTDHNFASGEEVAFQLRIKNTGDASFSKVEVKDTLPSFLSLVSGELSFEISELDSGETEIRDIKARVKDASQWPDDRSVICDVNQAQAKADNESAKDTAKLCVSQKLIKVKVLPVTGPEKLPWLLSFALIGGLTGLALIVLNQQ
jgi:uncharacterized repeat protein (TIGR01451 family)